MQVAAIFSDEILFRDEAPTEPVPFLKQRTPNDKARVARLLRYQKDSQTLKYLAKHHDVWMADPYLFADNIKLSQKAFSEPRTRAISEHFDTEQDNV